MDFTEPAEQVLLRQSVAQLAGSYGPGYFLGKARSGEKPTELWRELAKAGYVGVAIPEEYGGGGAGIGELATVCEELAAAGCPLLLLIVSSAIGATVLARYATTEQKRHWLPGIADGTRRLAFALTEPDAGSNSHRIRTTATPTAVGYRIQGTKYYISGADDADALLLVARTSAGELSLFLVDAHAPGLRRDPLPVAITSPEHQFTLYLDDVEVGKERLVGQEGAGLRQVFHGLNPERITAAATSVGLARYALGKAAAYARDRQVWDVPIGSHQGIAHPLAEAAIDLELARLILAKAAWAHDSGQSDGRYANMAKFFAADTALKCLDGAIQAHGGNGLALEYELAEYWGIARLMRIAPVSREMVLNHIAQHVLGLPRSY